MAPKHKAQNLNSRPRTKDIALTDDIDFKSMLFSEPILKGLLKCGYRRPSPIQLQALPLVRCGLDLIVQAKAGTGKTLVLAVAALELVTDEYSGDGLKVIVMAPTREIALQTCNVINAVGRYCEGLKCESFVGGRPVEGDKERAVGCRVAVGTPGRMRHLILAGILVPKHVRLFVLDEADKLAEEAFAAEINDIYSELPASKQVIALSATYTPKMMQRLRTYTYDGGKHCAPDEDLDADAGTGCVLLGVRQFAAVLPDHLDQLARFRLRDKCLLQLLGSVLFDQCIVFTNLQSRAEGACGLLRREDGPPADWISGRLPQERRDQAMRRLREQRVRVLCTTDLTARGVDIENVNLVINLDAPLDPQTYLHRMGRAGRFGAYGIVVTIVHSGKELEAFRKTIGKIGGASMSVSCVPSDLRDVDLWGIPTKKLEQIHGTVDPELSELEGSLGARSNDSDTSEDGDKITEHKSEIVDEESSPSSYKTQENEDAFNGVKCSCGFPATSAEGIEKICLPSLFCVAAREATWPDVSPAVIKESTIPLNTPFTLLGNKVVRVRSLSGKPPEVCSFVDDSGAKVVQFEESSPSENFLTYDEIKSVLVSGSYLENDNEEESLSYDTVVNLLDSRPDDCEKSRDDKVCSVLSEFTSRKELGENRLISFDSFDLTGWMAADKSLNILDSLSVENCEIYTFNLVTCPSGMKHIIPAVQNNLESDENCLNGESHESPVVEKNTESSEDNCTDSFIMALDLKEFHFDPPVSLKQIAEKIVPGGIPKGAFKHCNGHLQKTEQDDGRSEGLRTSSKQKPFISKNLVCTNSESNSNETIKCDKQYTYHKFHPTKVEVEKESERSDKQENNPRIKGIKKKVKKSSVAMRVLKANKITKKLKNESSSVTQTLPTSHRLERVQTTNHSRPGSESDSDTNVRTWRTWHDLHDCDESDSGPSEDVPCTKKPPVHINNHETRSYSSVSSSDSSKDYVSVGNGGAKTSKQELTRGRFQECVEPTTSRPRKEAQSREHYDCEASYQLYHPSPQTKNPRRFQNSSGHRSPQIDHPSSTYDALGGGDCHHLHHQGHKLNLSIGNGRAKASKQEITRGRFQELVGPTTSKPRKEAQSGEYYDREASYQFYHPSPQTKNPRRFQHSSGHQSLMSDHTSSTYDPLGGGDCHHPYHQAHGLYGSHPTGNSSANARPREVLCSNHLARDWFATWYSRVRQRALQLQRAEYVRLMSSPD